MRNTIRILLILAVVSINISCDQVSKTIVRERVSTYDRIPLLNNHLTVMKVENTGAFLSLGASLPPMIKSLLLLVVPLLALFIGFGYLLTRFSVSRLFVVGSCCIIGGGVGNLMDRLAYGSVTDFLHIQFGIFQTGIFNMADVSVMMGTGLILLNSFLQWQQENKQSI